MAQLNLAWRDKCDSCGSAAVDAKKWQLWWFYNTKRAAKAMHAGDVCTWLLACGIIAAAVAAEVDDIKQCEATIIANPELRTRWRTLVFAISVVRQYATVPAFVYATMSTLDKGADAASICLNSVALILLLEVDNAAFKIVPNQAVLPRAPRPAQQHELLRFSNRCLYATGTAVALFLPNFCLREGWLEGVVSGKPREAQRYVFLLWIPIVLLGFVSSQLEAHARHLGGENPTVVACAHALRTSIGFVVYWLVTLHSWSDSLFSPARITGMAAAWLIVTILSSVLEQELGPELQSRHACARTERGGGGRAIRCTICRAAPPGSQCRPGAESAPPQLAVCAPAEEKTGRSVGWLFSVQLSSVTMAVWFAAAASRFSSSGSSMKDAAWGTNVFFLILVLLVFVFSAVCEVRNQAVALQVWYVVSTVAVSTSLLAVGMAGHTLGSNYSFELENHYSLQEDSSPLTEFSHHWCNALVLAAALATTVLHAKDLARGHASWLFPWLRLKPDGRVARWPRVARWLHSGSWVGYSWDLCFRLAQFILVTTASIYALFSYVLRATRLPGYSNPGEDGFADDDAWGWY
jgi:hypothetical protein